MEKFSIVKSDGNIVSCIKEIPDCMQGIVICVHGFSSSKECPTFSVLRDKLPPAGFGMIGIDLPGHGVEESSKELLRIQGGINSIEAAEQYAIFHFPETRIYYFASSFGAYLTGLYISTRVHRGRKAFFRSAAVNMPELFIKDNPNEREKADLEEMAEKGYFDASMDDHPAVRITKEMFDDLKTTDLFEIFDASRFGENKIKMAHGGEDTVIDPNKAQAFAERFQIPLVMFENEGHSLSDAPETPGKVIDLAIDFFN